MKKFIGLRAKTCAYLMDGDTEHKKAKGTKKYITKRKLMFKNYKDCLLNDKIILQSQQRLKSDYHNVCSEQINKNALSSICISIKYICMLKIHLKLNINF